MALGAAILFGASAPVSKLLLARIDPQLLAGLLYLGAGIGLGLVRGIQVAHQSAALGPSLGRENAWALLGAILFGGVGGPLLLMLGLQRTPASSASLLLNLEGLATMVIAWVVLRENVDRRLLLGALAILAGAVAVSWHGAGVRFDVGAALIAGACLCWGVDNNVTRSLSSADPILVAMIKGMAAGSFNVGLALARGAPAPQPVLIGAAMVTGFFAIGVSLVLFVRALSHLGTARTAAYFSLAPFIGAVASVALLHEPATPQLAVAGALMGLGLWLHLTERHAHVHEHEALEHDHVHTHDAHHDHPHDGAVSGRHSHSHRHAPLRHAHPHYPDLHHRHGHGQGRR